MDRFHVIYDPTVESYIVVDRTIEVLKIKQEDVAKALTIALNQKQNLTVALQTIIAKHEANQLDQDEILKAKRILDLTK